MESPRYKAVQLLRQGKSPSQIAREMNVPLGNVMNYLYRLIGEGGLRRSDILFTLDRRARQEIEKIIQEHDTVQPGKIRRYLSNAGINVNADDLRIYLKLRDARVDLGDTYELIRDLELSLHKFIREALEREYGPDNWWREGVPLGVREDCAVINERDAEPAQDLFCYTTVMHLFIVLDKKWTSLSTFLPSKLQGNKQDFLMRLKRLNSIRNKVMHPVKGYVITEEDFDFLRELHADFAPSLAALAEQKDKQAEEQSAEELPAA
jgi:hypothetical protein